MAKRVFPPRVPPASDSFLILNPDVPIKEEVISDYNYEFFYPMNPGTFFTTDLRLWQRLDGELVQLYSWLGILICTCQDP